MCSQENFDRLLGDILSEGNTDFSEAVQEARETLEDGGVNTDNLWIPSSVAENGLKLQIEAKLTVIERAASSQSGEDFVNASFCIGSLKQAISRGEGGDGLWRVLEARRIFCTLVRLLGCAQLGKEDDEDAHVNIDAEDDEDDEDEDRMLKVATILDIFLFIYSESSARGIFRNPIEALSLKFPSADSCLDLFLPNLLGAALEEYTGESAIVTPLLDVLRVLCQHPENRECLLPLRENIDLSAKLNKSNVGINVKATELLDILNC